MERRHGAQPLHPHRPARHALRDAPLTPRACAQARGLVQSWTPEDDALIASALKNWHKVGWR